MTDLPTLSSIRTRRAEIPLLIKKLKAEDRELAIAERVVERMQPTAEPQPPAASEKRMQGTGAKSESLV